MANIFNLPEATGVSDNDYIYISGLTNGDRRIKAKKLVGGDPVLITKSITENGTYNASSDNAEGYSSVTVNVAGGVVTISQSDYDALSQAEKMNGSAYLIENGNKIYYMGLIYLTSLDLIGDGSDWQVTKQESNVSVNFSNNKIIETWNGVFGNGGINVCRTIKIPADANEIKYKIVAGTYQGRNYASDAIVIGLYPNISPNWVLADDNNFLVKKTYGSSYQNTTIQESLDVSNVHVDSYLYISSVMWNWTVDKLELL